MAKIIALGGAFLRANDPKTLYAWYEQKLGMVMQHGCLLIENGLEPTKSMVTFFPRSSEYFPLEQPVMLNFEVDDLEAVVEKLISFDPAIIEKREEYDFGSFAWFRDPEGNRVELWQAKRSAKE